MVLTPQSEEHFHVLWKSANFFIALAMLFVAIVIGFILDSVLALDYSQLLVMSAFLGVLYLVFISVLFDFNIFSRTRVVVKEVFREVEKPVVREVMVDRPVVREVVVEKPVYHRVPEYVYVERERRTLDIPKYAYVGSRETMTYHKRSCRFSKLIKKKYKVVNNSPSYFVRNKFSKCKSCLKAR